MKKLQVFICSLLLLTTPTLLAQGIPIQECSNHTGKHLPRSIKKKERYHLVTYDEILFVLKEIETEEIAKYREKDIHRVNEFLVHLAKEGVLPNAPNQVALQYDIDSLLGEDSCEFALAPSIFEVDRDCFQQVGLFSKPWEKTKKFLKKYKKEIIIGAVIVVAVATIVAVAVCVSAGAATAATAAGAAASTSPRKENEAGSSSPKEEPKGAPLLQETVTEQIDSFKEVLANESFFSAADSNQYGRLSMEETGRTLGHLFVNEGIANIQSQGNHSPRLVEEIDQLSHISQFAFTGTDGEVVNFNSANANEMFMQDRAPQFFPCNQGADFATLSYHGLGEAAFQNGYYQQAVIDFGKVIELSPQDPNGYLARSASYFHMGDYEQSMDDFQSFSAYSSQDPMTYPLSLSEFSIGFAKGIPKGAYESGEGILLFLADLATHPIQTAGQMYDALSTLAKLACTDEWELIGQSLAPEIHKLVTQWDTIPSDERGELAGFALGKYGTDILAPGALAKVAKQSVQSAKELAAVCKNLKLASETLVLETAAEIGTGVKIAEVVEAGQRTARLGEELGFTGKEMGQLKQAGKLESTVTETYEQLSLPMQESLLKHNNARKFLQTHKGFMPEERVRELIHETGFSYFSASYWYPQKL